MSKRLRLIILLAVTAFSAYILYPTIEWYFMLPQAVKDESTASREELRDEATKLADDKTQEFVDMLNGVKADNFAEMRSSDDAFESLYQEAKTRKKENKEKLTEDNAKSVGSAYESQNDVYFTLLNYYREVKTTLKNKKNKIINLGLDLSGGISAVLQVNMEDLETRLGHAPSDDEVTSAIDRAIFVLQSRVDKFGVSEPRIRRQGARSIRIEVPGDNDRERVNSFIQGKGAMAFQIVNEEATQKLIDIQAENPSWTYDKNNVPDFIPAGTKVMEYVVRDDFGVDQHQRWIAVYEDINTYGIDGSRLTQARVSISQLTNKPLVNFQLDSEGAQKLAKLTREYLNQSMAIVLEDKVRAYARLSAVITNGQAQISGFDRELASDISTILQTASLPVELLIVNQEVIGPSLGRTVIEAGLKALTIGLLLVVVFMLIYYKGSGVIAIISLIFNLYFLLSLLSSFSFTITLTGIAGIILTVGMAVDANVLIYERIKEEIRAGKTRRTAIDTAFKKAFWTILDANITTFIAAFFISQIATGSIQGFAVTLSIGIMTTLFSSLFITRLIYDIGTDLVKRRTVSISWRKLR